MMSKGLILASLLLLALILSGCNLGPFFGRAEAPLIVVSPAPENPQNTATPTPGDTPPSDVLSTLEEGTPSPGPLADEAPPAEIATATALMKVPTSTPTPTPTSERPKLEIQSSTIKLTEEGKKYLIEGKLFNSGLSPADLTDFKIVAYLYDKNGQRLASAVSRLTTNSLSPRAATTFKITVDYVAGVDTYKLQGGY